MFQHMEFCVRRKEGKVLFNDALNTFYLWLYGVRHMSKDHSDSEKGNPLPPHRLLLSINSKGSFICTIPQPLLHQSWSTGWNEKYCVRKPAREITLMKNGPNIQSKERSLVTL